MNYLLKIFYLDGKDISVILESKDVPRFIEASKKNEVFWDDKKDGGFWSATQNIRYINIIKQPQEVKDGAIPSNKSTTGAEGNSSENNKDPK